MKSRPNPVAKSLLAFKPKTVPMKTRYTRSDKSWKKEG
jgi:hypothetical protein